MDYDKFKKEYKAFEEWNKDKGWEYLDNDLPNLSMYNQDDLKDGKRWLRIVDGYGGGKDTPINEAVGRVGSIREVIDRFQNERVEPEADDWIDSIQDLIDRVKGGRVGPVDNDGNFYHPEAQNDLVNSPAHYTRGSQECIDTIEEAIQDAPNPITGSLQYQVLKYILRMWLKGNALRDAEKARWYLNRLISKLEDNK